MMSIGVNMKLLKFSLKDSGDTITVNETEKGGERVREFIFPRGLVVAQDFKAIISFGTN